MPEFNVEWYPGADDQDQARATSNEWEEGLFEPAPVGVDPTPPRPRQFHERELVVYNRRNGRVPYGTLGIVSYLIGATTFEVMLPGSREVPPGTGVTLDAYHVWDFSQSSWDPAPVSLDDTVQCEYPILSHHGSHAMTDRCVNPYRVVGGANANDLLISENARRIGQTRYFTQRFPNYQESVDLISSGSMPGRTYRIRMGSGDVNAAVRDVYPQQGLVLLQVTRRDRYPGTCVMRMAASLGQPVYAPQAPPYGITLPPTVTYASGLVNNDTPIRDTGHECTDDCVDYGCSEFSDYDDDEDYIDYGSGARVWHYSYRPELQFLGNGPLFLGAELEMSSNYSDQLRERMARMITSSDIGDHVYMKEDGSINGGGIEMVTHPMSYDWLIDNWDLKLLPHLRRAGALPHSSCGMHVHVSRAGFESASHAFKWIKFIYRNQDDIVALARRDANRWASFDHSQRRYARWFAKGGYGAERYSAINCTNPDTYEVRIFASTLSNQKYLGAVGLVDASVRYMAQATTQDILKRDGWGFAGFKEFVHSFDKYLPLQKEIKRLEL